MARACLSRLTLQSATGAEAPMAASTCQNLTCCAASSPCKEGAAIALPLGSTPHRTTMSRSAC
eukprot:8172307-Lingulodinium_polyedra.AAC.1